MHWAAVLQNCIVLLSFFFCAFIIYLLLVLFLYFYLPCACIHCFVCIVLVLCIILNCISFTGMEDSLAPRLEGKPTSHIKVDMQQFSKKVVVRDQGQVCIYIQLQMAKECGQKNPVSRKTCHIF